MSVDPAQQDVSALLRRIHEAALASRSCMPSDLFYAYPPGIAARILRSGLTVEDIEVDGPLVQVLASDGQVYACSTSMVSPIS